MPKIAQTAKDMIAGMTPELLPGEFVFATVSVGDAPPTLIAEAVSTHKEAEGLSLILPVDVAQSHDLNIDQPMRCITLNVYSSLEGVGLTAAVASILAQAGIACNMVAAFHHDHAFVPSKDSDTALRLLQDLQDDAGTTRQVWRD